jgi:type II secretory pathway component PulF
MDPTDFIIAAAIAVAGTFLGLAVVGLIHRVRRRGALSDRGWFNSVLIAVWVVLVIVVLFVTLVGLVGPLGLVWWATFVFVLIESLHKQQASQQNALLWLLAASAERDMPLGPAIEAFARENRGAFGRRARRLAKLLDLGVPLPDALDFCPGLLPPHALPILRVGCQSGALAPALRQAAAAKNQHDTIWASLFGKVSYLLLLPVFGVVVLTFVMIWIIPKYTKIFADFDASLPAMTQFLISVSYWSFNYWFVLSPLYLLIAGLLVHAVMRYLGWTDWELPGVSRLVRRLDTARILDGLAIVARQQKPLAEGLAALASTYPKSNIRQLLSHALHEMAAGSDWTEGLYHQQLIRRSDLALLQAAQRVGNLPWALQEMADSNRRRFTYRLQAIVQAAFPPVVIFFGLIVMFIAVAIFLPLVALIEKLAL